MKDEQELPCFREKDGNEWACIHDHTGCLYNNGNNECMHEGSSNQPLETEDEV